MTDKSATPLFTGGELALADTVILLMKVMSMHGIIDNEGITLVFADLERRYRGHDLHSAAAMAEYLRKHTTTGGSFVEDATLPNDVPSEFPLNHAFVNGDKDAGT